MNAAAIEVRVAVAEDLPQLVDIYNHYVLHTAITFDIEPCSVAERQPWFDQFANQGRHRLFVATASGALLGYAGTHQFRTKAAYETTVETTIYCAPQHVGRGVGTLLYETLLNALRGEDIASLIAGITLPNDASLALHERFDFHPAGTMHRVGRKFGRYWDVAWYERLR